MKRLYRKFLRFIKPAPKTELKWTQEDFEIARSFAKRLDHPQNSKLSFWDMLDNPWYDSVDVINEVNKIIRSSSPK